MGICDRVIARLGAGDAGSRWKLESMAVLCGMSDAATSRSVQHRTRSLIETAGDESLPRPAIAVAAYHAALANERARAVELARRALGPTPQPRPRAGRGPWFHLAVWALLFSERNTEAQVLIDRAAADARAAADWMAFAAALHARAWLAVRRGDLVAAESDARALLKGGELATVPFWRGYAASSLVLALVERGELDAAGNALEPVATDLQGTQRQGVLLRHARGRLRFALRRFDEAVADFLAAGEIATEAGAITPSYLAWRSDAALAHLRLGDREVARRLTAEEVELARSFGAPRALGVALRAAGLVEGGAPGEALLREAVEVLGGAEARLEHARALADLGALLRRGNRRVECRALLREAIDVAHRAGARLLAVGAETELRATGAKPRRMLLTGLEALTASERRIAELAADGLSNAEIAQALFVTVHTVEGHLTNVFTKLDVNGRAQLPAALAAPVGH